MARLKTPTHGSNTMKHISKIVPQVLDEEGIAIHSTDDDLPKIERITVEPVESNLMDSPLVRQLGKLTGGAK